MKTAVVLCGPRGVGKSTVARVLERSFGVHHVDADPLVLDLLAQGVQPHPEHGWLKPVREAVVAALRTMDRVSVEATGAFDSDYQLPADLEAHADRVLRVRLSAPLEETLGRIISRVSTTRVPVRAAEARAIYAAASERAASEHFDLELDLSGRWREADLIRAFRELLE